MINNKILVALDGSERSFRTIEYLCSFKPFHKKELVLHNVINKVPECYYDLKKDPFSRNIPSQVRVWEHGYRGQIEEFMEKSKMKLIYAGFSPKSITIMIANKKRGIARDIIDEAGKGYGSLLIRRRGAAQQFLPVVMGSVSTKLVEKMRFRPIMLAGTQKVNHSLLLAVDGSEGSKRAIKFVAEMINNSDCRVVLCSVLRDFSQYGKTTKAKRSNNCVSEVFKEIETIFEDAKKTFMNVGIQRKNVVVKVIQGAKSRSGSIVEAAKEEKCDTIVFGRKGHSDVSHFDIGRIPWKVIHGAKELTVWMVP